MADRDKSRIDEDAEDYITLGTLMRRQRSSEKKEAVERVVHAKLSTREKIRKIRRIDTQVMREPYRGTPPVRPKKTDPPPQPPPRVPRAYPRIKKKPPVSSFFGFLFKEYRNIRDFGRRSHILFTTFLPPGIQLNRAVGMSLDSELVPVCEHLAKVVEKALEVAWLHLKKGEYNQPGCPPSTLPAAVQHRF